MISIENKSRGPLTIILNRQTITTVEPRQDVDPRSGQSSLRRARMTLGTSLRLRRGEVYGGPRDLLQRKLSDSIKHEPHIKAAAARGDIKIIDLKVSN